MKNINKTNRIIKNIGDMPMDAPEVIFEVDSEEIQDQAMLSDSLDQHWLDIKPEGEFEVHGTKNYSESNNVYYFDADGLANNDGVMQPNTLLNTAAGDAAQLKWVPGQSGVYKELVNENEIDVSAHNTVYVVITSIGDFTTSASRGS